MGRGAAVDQSARSLSPARMIWHRYRQRGSAMIGLIIVGVALILSLLANLLVYDHTPYADLQQPTMPLRPMGFVTEVVHVIPTRATQYGLLDRLITGYDKAYDVRPYASIYSSSDQEIVIRDHLGQLTPIDRSTLLSAPGEIQVRYILGTDRFGRSIASRIIRGIRISMIVGGIAVGISLTLGIVLGLMAGYLRGWVDALIMYVINVTWSIPTLLLVFVIVLAFGRGIGIIFIAVGLTMWVDVARIVRGRVVELREETYISAAQSLGVRPWAIMHRHLLPNMMGPILVIAAANFATAILIEAGLSYLGFGISPPAPSLGNMLNDHYGYAISGELWLAIVPALVIMILVWSFNLIGAGLRDAFDVRE